MINISVPHNIASGKVLTSSSSVHNSPPEKAIDGKFNSGRMKPGGVCAHTKQEASWINIDLGTEHAISSIYLVGRGDTCDNCPAQSSGWTIRVGNTGTTTDPVCMENVISTMKRNKNVLLLFVKLKVTQMGLLYRRLIIFALKVTQAPQVTYTR